MDTYIPPLHHFCPFPDKWRCVIDAHLGIRIRSIISDFITPWCWIKSGDKSEKMRGTISEWRGRLMGRFIAGGVMQTAAPPKQTLAGWFSPKIQGANISVRFMHGNDVLAMTTPSFLWNFPRVVIKTGCCLKKHQVCIRWCIPSTLKIPCDCLSVCSLYFSDKFFLSFFLLLSFLLLILMLRFILMDYMYKLWTTPPPPLPLYLCM